MNVNYLSEEITIPRVELLAILYLSQMAESLAANHSLGEALSDRIVHTVRRCADRIEHIAQYALDLDLVTRMRNLADNVEIMHLLLRDHASDFHPSLGLPTIKDLDVLFDVLRQFIANETNAS